VIVTVSRKYEELMNIQNILHKGSFPLQLIDEIQKKTENTHRQNRKQYVIKMDYFRKSGVYQLIYNDFGKTYMAQTGSSFAERCKKHFISFKDNIFLLLLLRWLNRPMWTFASLKDCSQSALCLASLFNF
jgi:hypothetical protein